MRRKRGENEIVLVTWPITDGQTDSIVYMTCISKHVDFDQF